MATSFTATQVAGISLAAAVVAGIGTYFIVAYETERRETTIVLAIDPATSQCKAQNPLPLLSKHKKHLAWNINNGCSAAQYVELRNFAEVDTTTGTPGPAETGIVPGDVVRATAAFPANTNTRQGLETDPTKTVSKLTAYKYEIWISAVLPTAKSLDPDIEWWK
jgi:hypothetical protein